MREVDDPSAYVRLLRYLFRALAQAKFDLLYREVVPVLQPCLDTLLALSARAGHARAQRHGGGVVPGRSPRVSRPSCRTCLDWRIPCFARSSPLAPSCSSSACARWSSGWTRSTRISSTRASRRWNHSSCWRCGRCSSRNNLARPLAPRRCRCSVSSAGAARGFLREPLELEAKSNPEHGLRLILTFKPETSFLVPLDRCIQLMKTILAAPPVPNLKGAEALVEHRRQALSFLRARVCRRCST